MAMVKLTKTEQKHQKDALKRYLRYLPTLQLKKQQLQMVLMQTEAQQRVLRSQKDELYKASQEWLPVVGDPSGGPFGTYLTISDIRTSQANIAGIDIRVFESISFEHSDYDLFAEPLWVDSALELLEKLLEIDVRVAILDEQYQRIAAELRVTSQRVNLFEKIKIPEALENIRRIQIYLGDQQTASVVRGKIAKKNLLQEVVR